MTREELFAEIENMNIGPDDTFKFRCTMCGKCCVDREDILLNPRDMYRISKYLDLPPVQILRDYCEYYIGHSSNVPIVRLRPEGPQKRCPMLKGMKCLVHEAKPSVCAMYPLGRYMKFDASNFTPNAVAKASVQYILQPIDCGDQSEIHTVREWLADFNVEAEDEAYIKWNMAISEIGSLLKKMRSVVGESTMLLAERCALAALYLNYTFEEDFLIQFEKNVAELVALFRIIDNADIEGTLVV